MSSNHDWLQHNHESLYNQVKSTVGYLTDEVLTRIGIVGSILIWYTSSFLPKYHAYCAAFEAWQNPAERTPAKTATLKTAEDELKLAYRALYSGYLKRNPLVTDTDLVEMSLPKHSSGGKTPPSPPEDVIEATSNTSKPGIVGINYRDKNAKSNAKPKHVRGAEIAWNILDTPPTDWAELIHSAFDTRTPAELSFSGNDRGKTLYFALRWENNVGEKGPWSEIYSAIIP